MSEFYRQSAEKLKALLADCKKRYEEVEAEVEALEEGPETPELEKKTRELENLESLQEVLDEALSLCD